MNDTDYTPEDTEVSDVQHLSFSELAHQTTDAVIGAITEAQEQFLKTAQTVAEVLPKAPDIKIPGADSIEQNVPSVREIVEANLAFAEKLLANQKAYAQRLFDLAGV